MPRMTGMVCGLISPADVVQDLDEPAQVRALDFRRAGPPTC